MLRRYPGGEPATHARMFGDTFCYFCASNEMLSRHVFPLFLRGPRSPTASLGPKKPLLLPKRNDRKRKTRFPVYTSERSRLASRVSRLAYARLTRQSCGNYLWVTCHFITSKGVRIKRTEGVESRQAEHVGGTRRARALDCVVVFGDFLR